MAEHAPPQRDRPTSLHANLLSAIAGVLVVALGVLGVMWLSGSDDTSPTRQAAAEQPGPSRAGKPPARKGDFAKLVESTTHTTLKGTQRDQEPQARTRGDIVRPEKVVAIYQRPGGKAVGKIGPRQIGETWLPVIGKQGGWVQVLLPSKPNGSTGWLKASQLEQKFTPYLIAVHLRSMRLELLHTEQRGGPAKRVGDWEIGIGKPDTPTPTGRTFLLGSMVDPNQQYSPVILPLGAHSDTLDTFGGGPGTVAIHTWPTTDVLGTATSHGCIRVPQQALTKLREVPLGTLVLVDQQ
ncbi:MAG: L,D-transpeptidase family protein [Thermocrispum sp.]